VNSQELHRFPLLKEIDSEGLEALSEWLESEVTAPGCNIFEEGEHAGALLLVSSGTVRLESSRSALAARVKAGSALGGVSLIAGGTREMSAIAESECELLMLSETAFRNLLEEAPRVACQVAIAIGLELASCARQSLDALSGVGEVSD